MDAVATTTNFKMKLLRHQSAVRRALSLQVPQVILVGGLGCAKTVTHYIACLFRAQQTPGGRQLLVMPTAGMVDDVAVPTFEHWLFEHKIRHYWRKPTGRTNLYIHVAGKWTEIRFRSGDRPERLDGGEYCHIGGDEWGQVAKKTHQRASARARGYDYVSKLFTGTPEGVQGPFFNEAEGNRQKGTVVIRAKTDDNEFLKPSPQEYIRELCKGYSPEELEAYRKGYFIPPRGRMWWAFNDDNIKVCENPMRGRAVMGCDFNVTPMHWVMADTWGSKDRLFVHIFDEVVREETNTWAHSETTADRWTEYQGNDYWSPNRTEAAELVTAYCDAAGRARSTKAAENDFSAMRKNGFKVIDARSNPSIKDSAFSMNTLLHQGRLLVDPRCVETIKCLKSQGRDKYNEPDKTQGLDHATDACRYLTWGLAPNAAPRGNTTTFGYR